MIVCVRLSSQSNENSFTRIFAYAFAGILSVFAFSILYTFRIQFKLDRGSSIWLVIVWYVDCATKITVYWQNTFFFCCWFLQSNRKQFPFCCDIHEYVRSLDKLFSDWIEANGNDLWLFRSLHSSLFSAEFFFSQFYFSGTL